MVDETFESGHKNPPFGLVQLSWGQGNRSEASCCFQKNDISVGPVMMVTELVGPVMMVTELLLV